VFFEIEKFFYLKNALGYTPTCCVASFYGGGVVCTYMTDERRIGPRIFCARAF
jgi:hypothetical protein